MGDKDKKLFRVRGTVEYDMYVMADDEDQAIEIAESAVEEDPDACGTEGAWFKAKAVDRGESIPAAWQWSVPFGSEDDTELPAKWTPKS